MIGDFVVFKASNPSDLSITISSEAWTEKAGGIKSGTLTIDSSLGRLIIFTIDFSTSLVSVTLTSPSGKVYDPNYKYAVENIQFKTLSFTFDGSKAEVKSSTYIYLTS